MGAVGPNDYVQFTNGVWYVVNLSTGHIDSFGNDRFFWQGALPSSVYSGIANLGDPRIVYDPLVSRWIATEDANLQPGYRGSNEVLMAVSQTSDPAGIWHGIAIPTHPVIGGKATWVDQPRLGADRNGVYIIATEFSNDQPVTTSYGEGIYTFAASNAFWTGSNYPSTYTAWTNLEFDNDGSGLYPKMQPATNFTSGSGYPEMIAGVERKHGGNNTVMLVNTINWSGSTPSLGATGVTPFNPSTNVIIPAPSPAYQPGNVYPLDAGDGTISNVVVENTNLWTCLPEGPGVGPGLGDGFAIIEMPMGALNTLQNVSHGFSPPYDQQIYPSIAVSSNNTWAVGFTDVNYGPSGYGLYASTDVVAGSSDGTYSSVARVNTGTEYYTGFNGEQSPYRWGDYSATCVDPNNASIFWTFQEDSRASISSEYTITIGRFQVTTTPGGAAPLTSNNLSQPVSSQSDVLESSASVQPVFADVPISIRAVGDDPGLDETHAWTIRSVSKSNARV